MKFTNYNDLARPWDWIIGTTPQWIAVSPKYNGVSCRLIRSDKDGSWHAQTRQGNRWPIGFFDGTPVGAMLAAASQLTNKVHAINCEILADDPSTKLATLAGWVSVSRDQLPSEARIHAVIYDAYVPMHSDYLRRMELIKQQSNLSSHPLPLAVIFPPYDERARRTFEEYCEKMTALSGEGCIIKMHPAPYFSDEAAGIDPFTVKRKLYTEEEGEVVAVLEGEGKRRGKLGAFIVRRRCGSEVKIGGGAGLTDELLEQYWRRPPIGAPLTFRYEELSVYGTPLRPQFVAIRNYE